MRGVLAQRARRVYLFEAGGALSCAFVQHPHLKGMWLRTDPAAALAACDDCQAEVGEPCKSRDGQVGSFTHDSRRRKAASLRPEPLTLVIAGGQALDVPAAALRPRAKDRAGSKA